jgi:hypothetical protein
MKEKYQPSKLETVFGSLPVEITATAIASLAAGPLAPLLPVLTKSLASTRQQARITKFLEDISHRLDENEQALRNLSDEQYKLINECILAALHTTEEEKLTLLKTCVTNSMKVESLEAQEAVTLSRIIRDISIFEAECIVKWHPYKRVHITDRDYDGSKNNKIVAVLPQSQEALAVSGLLALGVLTPGQPTLGQTLEFSSITPKLANILSESA